MGNSCSGKADTKNDQTDYNATTKNFVRDLQVDSSNIGVDFGTGLGCFGIYEKNVPAIVQNVQGKRVTDTCLIVNAIEFMFGDIAKAKLDRNIKNSVYDILKLVGKKESDKEWNKVAKYWPFEVSYINSLETDSINQVNQSTPIIKLSYMQETENGEEQEKFLNCTPEKLIGLVLEFFLKLTSNKTDGQNHVRDIILTTPNNYGYLKKQTMSMACTHHAGLNVKKIIKSGRSVALAQRFTYPNEYTTSKNVIFFDLGAGYLDVTLVNYEENFMAIMATACDESLGGRLFDIKILEYCVNHFKQQKGIDLFENKKALRRLLTQCEKAKIDLSILNKYEIFVEYIANEEDFSLDFSREKFEYLCKKEFEACQDSIKKVISEGKINASNIDEVILTGGSIRIPKIQELIENIFGKDKVRRSFNPDEAAAHGAVLHGGLVYEDQYIHSNYKKQKQMLQQKNVNMPLQIFDVTPMNLGINLNGTMHILIKANTVLPCKAAVLIKPLEINQNFVTIDVLEGNTKMTKQCDLIGRIMSTPLSSPSDQNQPRTRSKKIISKFEVVFDLDQNFNLEVSLNIVNTTSSQKIIINDVMSSEITYKQQNTEIQLDK